MADTKNTVIVGAGPTGIGAARRLDELGADWVMLEKESYVGGLSASFVAQDYVWDIGGHVIFSHYKDYDDLLAEALAPEEWMHHARNAQILVDGTWVPYPFQLNLDALPEALRNICRDGMNHARDVATDRSSFASYIQTHFGTGVADVFMRPYNQKIWACPLNSMSVDWIGERVANVQNRPKDTNWGPNNRFRFPVQGGTGAIWKNAVRHLPKERIRLGAEIVSINPGRREVLTAHGGTIPYRTLISTMPIDRLAQTAGLVQSSADIPGLSYTSVHVVGLGVAGATPDAIADYCWMYFPGSAFPFYRATVFSRYSPNNVPPGYWSLMLEISDSPHRPESKQGLVARCIDACVGAGLIHRREDVAHTWHHRAEHGYPVPTLQRDRALAALNEVLEPTGIFSRGRFGAWKYEVGNMDHCYMQGREIADRIVLGTEESVCGGPGAANKPDSRA